MFYRTLKRQFKLLLDVLLQALGDQKNSPAFQYYLKMPFGVAFPGLDLMSGHDMSPGNFQRVSRRKLVPKRLEGGSDQSLAFGGANLDIIFAGSNPKKVGEGDLRGLSINLKRNPRVIPHRAEENLVTGAEKGGF